MDTTVLGVVLDSSVIVAAERKKQTVEDFLLNVRLDYGEIEVVMSAITIAELVHGVARATTQEIRERRRAFIDELKRHVPVHPISEETAEIAGMIGGVQAAKGVILPLDDLLIGACAIEQGYAVATLNLRHFQKIPDLKVISF